MTVRIARRLIVWALIPFVVAFVAVDKLWQRIQRVPR